MAYDGSRDRRGAASSPAEAGYNLTASMVSDTADLAVYGKALRIRNGSTADIKIVMTPIHASADTSTMTITIGVGEREILPIAVRRIWSTGSTGLVAGIGAGTVEANVFTE